MSEPRSRRWKYPSSPPARSGRMSVAAIAPPFPWPGGRGRPQGAIGEDDRSIERRGRRGKTFRARTTIGSFPPTWAVILVGPAWGGIGTLMTNRRTTTDGRITKAERREQARRERFELRRKMAR